MLSYLSNYFYRTLYLLLDITVSTDSLYGSQVYINITQVMQYRLELLNTQVIILTKLKFYN